MVVQAGQPPTAFDVSIGSGDSVRVAVCGVLCQAVVLYFGSGWREGEDD